MIYIWLIIINFLSIYTTHILQFSSNLPPFWNLPQSWLSYSGISIILNIFPIYILTWSYDNKIAHFYGTDQPYGPWTKRNGQSPNKNSNVASVTDGWQALSRHCVNVSCLLDSSQLMIKGMWNSHLLTNKYCKYRIKPEELYILSCGKGRGWRPRPFPQLRM